MIVKSKVRVKAGRKFFSTLPGLAFLLGVLSLGALSGSLGCATSQERQARQVEERTYELALRNRVQAHVYSMSCAALLPLAADLLWEHGYGDSQWTHNREGLLSEWREQDPMRRSRYEVHSQQVGSQRCAVQMLRHEETGRETTRERDPLWELRLLDHVDEDAGQSLRFRARQEAHNAYERVLEEWNAER